MQSNIPDFHPGDGKIHPDGYFCENNKQWPGICSSLQVKNILLETQSEYQDILVFESETFGNVLVLDGVIQLTERDEASYQEVLAHTPLNVVKNPEQVLIIGGGDGGVLRECLRYEGIKKVTQCEIDEGVIMAAKEFFPDIASGFENARTNLIIGDGAEFIKNTLDTYDSVIVDSSDPIGPAESLFLQQFYEDLKTKMNPGASLAIQGESLFLHKELAEKLIGNMREIFKYAEYAQVHVPTYPGGNIGILTCSDTQKPSEPIGRLDPIIQNQLKYYSNELHRASFVLPHNLQNI